jgi:hypothetical protein
LAGAEGGAPRLFADAHKPAYPRIRSINRAGATITALGARLRKTVAVGQVGPQGRRADHDHVCVARIARWDVANGDLRLSLSSFRTSLHQGRKAQGQDRHRENRED